MIRARRLLTEQQEPKYRYKQLSTAIYQNFVTSFDEITTFPQKLRDQLAKIPFNLLQERQRLVSADGNTTKLVLERHDGTQIETVLMQHDDGRNTVCVSCMVGCPVNCSFCATGKMGFAGNLEADEIVEQILIFARELLAVDQKVTNVVFMGMGEPMLNLVEVKAALDVLHNEMGMGQRRITVSTSGYIPQLKDLIESGFRGRIAVSLHAPNQKLRQQLMPVARLYDLDKLMSALFEFEQITGKRISYEYIMIDGVTDTDECARQLGKLLQGHLAHVNLIPYNPVPGEDFERSRKRQIYRFKSMLDRCNVNATVRITMGDDISAACGQLVKKSDKKAQKVKLPTGLS